MSAESPARQTLREHASAMRAAAVTSRDAPRESVDAVLAVLLWELPELRGNVDVRDAHATSRLVLEALFGRALPASWDDFADLCRSDPRRRAAVAGCGLAMNALVLAHMVGSEDEVTGDSASEVPA